MPLRRPQEGQGAREASGPGPRVPRARSPLQGLPGVIGSIAGTRPVLACAKENLCAFGVSEMSELVADCPRCGAQRTTFDVVGHPVDIGLHDWQHEYELFSRCRHCMRTTVFVVRQKKVEDEKIFKIPGVLVEYKGALNDVIYIHGYVSLRDQSRYAAPDHVPEKIEKAFNEGATCLAVECWNAAAAMFRLCVDLYQVAMIMTDGPNRPCRWT
jgi:hypothetical protein